MIEWIPADEWATIVESVPVPSVDLIVSTDDGIVLAKRENNPAKGEWFVPGGRIKKGERLTDAVQRVADEELGVDVTICERLGAYDHLYDVSDVPDTSKHYVAHGFVVTPDGEPVVNDDQHSSIEVFRSRPPGCHEYVADYLDDAERLSI